MRLSIYIETTDSREAALDRCDDVIDKLKELGIRVTRLGENLDVYMTDQES